MERQRGTVEVEVKGVSAEKVWSFLDFGNAGQLSPDVESCTILEGVAGEPGCRRHIVLKRVPGIEVGRDGNPFVPFMNEKLLAIDHEEFSHKYAVMENNWGFVGLSAQKKVVDLGGGDSKIEWSFEAESLGPWSLDELSNHLLEVLQGMAKTIERAVEEGEA